MATVRIQVRRGTASQWTSANPTLAAGEMGVESDTNLFKFGNGSTAWASLAYANNSDVAIAEISQDAIDAALSVGSGLTKTYNDGANTITIAVSDAYFTELAQDAVNNAFVPGDGIAKSYNDASNTITVSVVDSYITELAQDSVNTAIIAGDGIAKVYNDSANTLTLDADLATSGGLKIDNTKLAVDTDIVVTKTGTQTLTNKTLTNPSVNGVAVTVSGTQLNYLTGLTKNISNSYVDVLNDANDYTDAAIGTLGNTSATTYVPLSIVGQADGLATLNNIGKIPMSQISLIAPALTGNATAENLTISGDLVFNGTATTINSTNLNITDPLVYLAKDNPANTRDLGIVSSFNDGTYQHTGLVRDHTANKWVFFKGVTDEPTTTVNLAQGSLDALAVGALTATSLDLGSVTNTEIGYLDGVTSPIQTQLGAKAPLESPTFTGVVTLPSQTVTSAMIADATIATGDLAESAVTANKLASDAVSTVKILDLNVTTAKIADTAVTTAKIADSAITSAKIADATIVTGDLADSAVTSAKIANETIVNADINASAAIDWTKLAISSTVSATELGYVDGVTSAIQTQIDAQLAKAGGEMTGDLTLRGNPTTNNMAATKNYVDSLVTAETTNRGTAITAEATARGTAIETAVTTHAALTASHGVTGAVVGTQNTQTLTNKTLTSPVINTPTGITKSDVGLANVDNTSDANKPVSSATQTALDLKAPLANPTFTGTVSGITKSMVGLGSVDNTADTAKPISTATQTALDLKAPLASPALTGTPTAPTAAAADNSTKVATTAYADRAASNAAAALVASAPAALDTLNELATALGNDASFSTTMTNALAAKAPLASPTFTGTVTLPSGTVTSGMILDGTIVDADINASAAIAQSKISGLTSDLAAKAPLASPTFTGTVTVAASGVAFTDGTQTKEGVPSRTTISQKTANYTLAALTERDSMIEMNSASATTLTVPTNATLAYPVGTTIDILRVGAGAVDVAAAAGVTINATPGLKLRAQWSSATLMKRATDTWVLLGDLMA